MNKLMLKKFKLVYPFILLCGLSVSLNVAAQTVDDAEEDIDSVQVVDQQAAKQQDAAPKQEYAENYVFADPHQRKLFLELTGELRCPKCQNQAIADSDAPISHDMRRKVYQLMQQGNDKTEVIDWMKSRYGDFVHYQPPVTFVTMWLWITPVLFAAIMLLFFVRRRKPEYDQDSEAKIAKAEKMLKED